MVISKSLARQDPLRSLKKNLAFHIEEYYPGSATFGVDIEPGVWHTLIVLEPDTSLFEVKDGPYSPGSDKDFAEWSPAEGTPESARFLDELIKQTGGMPSGPGR